MLSSIDFFAAGSILLLAFLMLTNPREVNILGNRLLALLLLLVAILVYDKGLYDQGFYLQHITFLGVTDIVLPMLAPTLYLSVVYFVAVDKSFDKKHYWHYLLSLLLLPIYFQFYFLTPEVKLKYYESTTYPYSAFSCIIILQLIFYWILAYWKLQKHEKDIQLFAANTEKIDLKWLKYSLCGIAMMIVAFLAEMYFNNSFVATYASLAYLFATYILAYYALRQSEIFPFSTQEREEIKDIIEETTVPIPKQERLSETQIPLLKERLLDLMTTEKIHLIEDLNLPKLAGKMAISTHDLSYLLNAGFGQSFFEFINTYRVEEAKQLLLSKKHRHLNMIGIAYSAGFSSKTTFYAAFKKITQQSPSEFQANYKNK
jgi:AraC-like DNA-binding protein